VSSALSTEDIGIEILAFIKTCKVTKYQVYPKPVYTELDNIKINSAAIEVFTHQIKWIITNQFEYNSPCRKHGPN
jgi:hypothetical protein